MSWFQLTEVNDSMAEYTSGFNLGQPNATQLHTLQRHRDILQGYSHEFSKTKVKFLYELRNLILLKHELGRNFLKFNKTWMLIRLMSGFVWLTSGHFGEFDTVPNIFVICNGHPRQQPIIIKKLWNLPFLKTLTVSKPDVMNSFLFKIAQQSAPSTVCKW